MQYRDEARGPMTSLFGDAKMYLSPFLVVGLDLLGDAEDALREERLGGGEKERGLHTFEIM